MGKTLALQAMAASSACLVMYSTASGPSVSYRGTGTTECAWQAASTSIQSAGEKGGQLLGLVVLLGAGPRAGRKPRQLTEYRPQVCPGCSPSWRRPEPI